MRPERRERALRARAAEEDDSTGLVERRDLDRRPAAATRQAGPAMDVVLLALDAAAGDGPRVRVLVGREQGVGARDRTGKALWGDLADGHPWREPLQEEGLRHVHGAQPCEVALVEQRRADDGFRLRRQVGHGSLGVPGWAEHVRPEVA